MSAITGAVGSSLGSMMGGTFGWTAATWSQIGWTAGVLVGTYLFQPDGANVTNEGTRLDDLKVTTSTYGMDIPKVYGAYRISGNIIWALPLSETRHEETQESGKGGGGSSETSIWYTYTGTWAVALCEGPVTGIKKIWFGSKLVYDNGDYSAPLTSSNCRIYLGRTSQVIDWEMQANQQDTPAYRHTSYIVFSSVDLEDVGNIIPNVTVEVVNSGTNDVAVFKAISNVDVSFQDESFNTVCGTPVNVYNTNENPILLQYDGSISYLAHMVNINITSGTHSALFTKYHSTTPILIENKQTFFRSFSPCYYSYYHNHFAIQNCKCKTGWMSASGSLDSWSSFVRYYEDVNSLEPTKIINSTNPTGDVGAYVGITNNPCQATFYKDNFYFLNVVGNSVLKGTGIDGYPVYDPDDYGYSLWEWQAYDAIGVQYEGQLHAIVGSSTYTTEKLVSFDVNYDKLYMFISGPGGGVYFPKSLEIRDLDGLLLNKIDITTHFINTLEANVNMFVDDGYIHIVNFQRNLGTYYNRYDLYGNLLLQKFPSDFGDIVRSWVGYFDSFGVENMKYGGGNIKFIPHLGISPNYYSEDITINLNFVDGGTTIKPIIDSICEDAGLDISDYDTIAGISDVVDGYVVSKRMSARSAIEPVLSTYEYSFVETDHQLVLRKENQNPILTINKEDLGANSENKIESKIAQNSDLMKRITLRFANNQSDYQTSVQSSMRTDVTATNEITKELPFAITDAFAKQLAEKTLYKNWLAKYTYSIKVPLLLEYSTLIAGDVITVEFYDYIKNMKVIKITLTEDNLINIEAMETETSVYVSNAEAESTSGNSSNLIPPVGITKLAILDVPTLSNSYIQSEGLYIAASGYTSSWTGCSVYSKSTSIDDFSNEFAIIGKSSIGESIYALGDGETTVWDLENELVVTSTNQLFSITKESVLNGNGYAIIGNEIIQFATVVDNLDNTYTLSDLLRGRRGTEHETGNHLSGEIFVLLNPVSTGFSQKTIGSTKFYSAISFSDNVFSIEQEVEYTGNNLRPFSVSVLTGNRDISNDITIEWMRRSRYISGYMKTLPIVDVPESYSIDVYESGIFITTYTTSITSFIYDSTKAIADSVTLTNEMKFIVYHKAPIYGNGVPTQIIIGSV